MDTRIWRNVDGHLFRSVPTDLPEKWRRIEGGLKSGEYTIKRIPTGLVRRSTYELYRLGIRIGFAMPTEKAAKSHALLNARGEDRVNVA